MQIFYYSKKRDINYCIHSLTYICLMASIVFDTMMERDKGVLTGKLLQLPAMAVFCDYID